MVLEGASPCNQTGWGDPARTLLLCRQQSEDHGGEGSNMATSLLFLKQATREQVQAAWRWLTAAGWACGCSPKAAPALVRKMKGLSFTLGSFRILGSSMNACGRQVDRVWSANTSNRQGCRGMRIQATYA